MEKKKDCFYLPSKSEAFVQKLRKQDNTAFGCFSLLPWSLSSEALFGVLLSWRCFCLGMQWQLFLYIVRGLILMWLYDHTDLLLQYKASLSCKYRKKCCHLSRLDQGPGRGMLRNIACVWVLMVLLFSSRISPVNPSFACATCSWNIAR